MTNDEKLEFVIKNIIIFLFVSSVFLMINHLLGIDPTCVMSVIFGHTGFRFLWFLKLRPIVMSLSEK